MKQKKEPKNTHLTRIPGVEPGADENLVTPEK